MKQFFPAVPLIFVLTFGCLSTVKAQYWTNFGQVLSQLDSNQRQNYTLSIQSLSGINPATAYNYGGALRNLNSALIGKNPIGSNFDGIVPPEAQRNQQLSELIGASGLFSNVDSSQLMVDFGRLNGIWETRNDTLYRLFDLNKNQLSSPPDLPKVNPMGSEWQKNLDSLKQDQNIGFQASSASGVDNIKGLFQQLFSRSLFSMMELNAGSQTSSINYYGKAQKWPVPTVGVRTVEQFDRRWEARWRFQTSWITQMFRSSSNGESGSGQKAGIQPLLLNGSFDMMFTPNVVPGPTGDAVRVIALLGIEVGTYVPSHKDPTVASNANNKGFTTGYGPVIGAGVATKFGNMTIYAMGTSAFGDVICSPGAAVSNYRYRSNRLEAGIRLANTITVRYENGLSINWARANNKSARFHQFTIGLPTAALLR